MIRYKTSAPEGYVRTNCLKLIADSRFRGEKVLCQMWVEAEGDQMHDGKDVLRVKREIWVSVDCENGTLDTGEGE